MALDDRMAIFKHISQENTQAAIELDLEFEAKAESAERNPKLYRVGRIRGTREIVVRPSYVMVYRITSDDVEILRVLHAAQQWPKGKKT